MNKYLLCLLMVLTLVGCSDNEHEYHVVSKQTFTVDIVANGELESAQRAVVAPPSIARMWQYKVQFLAPENTEVKKGDVVVRFDDKPVRERLVEKQSEYQRALKELENLTAQEVKSEEELKLGLAEAKMTFEVAKRKAEIEDNSVSEIDRKKAQIDFQIANKDYQLAKKKLQYQRDTKVLNIQLAKGKASRLKSEVDNLNSDIDRLKVKAPIDGLVIYATNYNGDKPVVGESVQFGQPVIRLSVIEDMQVKAQINEVDFGKLALGQAVKVTIDAPEQIVTTGKVVSIGSAFRAKSYQDKRRILDAIISLDEIDPKQMRPGLSARAEITTKEVLHALSVPLTTLQADGEHVFVTNDSGNQQAVTVNQISNGFALIGTGLSEGDKVRL